MHAWRQMRIRGTEDSVGSAYSLVQAGRPSLPSIEPLSTQQSQQFALTPHWRSNVGIPWHFRAVITVINSENTCANPKAMPEKARGIR